MDVEDVIGLAPQANVRVYEGPPSGAGAYDTYARIVSDDVAKVVTTSWGLCESQEGMTSAAAENTLFQEAAIQGQTILASSGDAGHQRLRRSSSGRRRSLKPAVGDRRRRQRDPVLPPRAPGTTATARPVAASPASGPAPAYQTAAQPQSSTTCGTGGTSCREVPDVTADGDPNTGYVIYYDGQWNTMGGTSISTPTWAAIAALADASPACAGHPIGFANPALYRLASTAYAANFGDVTGGSNGYGGVPGFAAGPGYDMASGLGTPNAGVAGPVAVRRLGHARHARRSAFRRRRAAAAGRQREQLLGARRHLYGVGSARRVWRSPRRRARSPARRQGRRLLRHRDRHRRRRRQCQRFLRLGRDARGQAGRDRHRDEHRRTPAAHPALAERGRAGTTPVSSSPSAPASMPHRSPGSRSRRPGHALKFAGSARQTVRAVAARIVRAGAARPPPASVAAR